MGTAGQTHTASFSLRLSPQINSHSSRALSCLKLHLWIIGHLLPERPQCGIMRIRTRAEQAEPEKCKRVEQRRRADTGLIPASGQNPSKHLFCRGVRPLYGTAAGFLGLYFNWGEKVRGKKRLTPGWFSCWKRRRSYFTGD